MAPKSSVFLLGPGFIGLEILSELLKQGYSVTTLVRRDEARTSLEQMGSKTVKGSLDDHDVIRYAAANNDITIHTATADHKPSAIAILDGIAERAKSGKSSIYIHTSGCSAITDKSEGKYVSDKIYEDDKPETIDSIADDAPHRQIDLAILGHRKQLGFAGFCGGGKAVWGQVHVSDLAKGYMTILHYMESSSGDEVLKNPYFFIENGDEHSWEKMAAEIGTALHNAGKLQDPKPREIPSGMFGDLFQEWSVAVIGENARNRVNRLRALGWKPQGKSTFDSFVEDELPVLLAEKGEYQGYAAPVAS
ncbi:NAD(P)-binding protein [Hyaloscypha bicolor E]|uniref:NAD(P)-binding protein n=1 Tax=Hyaloscypha bicolor E TaxID=1095630 RepID=A0A2J6T6W5_9HELO|nr:NAD(P)-binding protein [Hyaloscypha bicolor E]PMD58754.1 NAD(P)-binding protein [Hyaloscypha bicolor E]